MKAQLEQVLEPRLSKLLEHWPIPGGVAAIVHGAKSGVKNVQIQPFGFADPYSKIPTKVDHGFEIGSISKSMTAMVVLSLVNRHEFSIDDKITKLIPWIELPKSASSATVRHLLNHSSGIVAGLDQFADEKAHAVLLRETEATARPGSLFHYSNSGYVLLGLIAESATGESLEELTNRIVFEPSGMRASKGRIRYSDTGWLAQGSVPSRDDQPWLPGDPLMPSGILETKAGDGHVISDAADMVRYVEMLLGSGSLEGRTVIDERSFGAIHSLLSVGGEDIFTAGRHVEVLSSNYGLGLNVEKTKYGTQLTHGGGMVGYATFLIADLANDIGVIVLTNSNGDTPIAEYLAREIHAELLGDLGKEPFELDPSLWDPKDVMLGEFRTEKGQVRVSKSGGQVQIETQGAKGLLFRTLSDRFATDLEELRDHHLSFSVESNGAFWNCGSESFSKGLVNEATESISEWYGFEGHYRAYSPWFSNFRVYQRDGCLYLAAVGGVEAPSGEQELIQIDNRKFRIGENPMLPERIVFRGIVDGSATFAEINGCKYTRIF